MSVLRKQKVVGNPGTGTDEAITVFNGTTGNQIKSSEVLVEKGGNVFKSPIIQHNTFFGRVSHTTVTLPSAATVSYVYQDHKSNSIYLTLDRNIVLNLDIQLVEAGSNVEIIFTIIKD